MRTLTEKYNGVLKGIFSKDQFLRDARMEQSNLITQYNSYNDAVNILINKGLISEIAFGEYGEVGEGMTPEEWADAEGANRLAKHPEKKKIEDIKAMMAKEKKAKMAEEHNSVKAKYLEIVSYFNNVARSISPEESYKLHNMLKDYFNRMFEGTIEEAPTTVERNDELEHIHSGLTFKVSTSSKTRISGPVTKAGKFRGKDYRVHDLIQIKPILVGTEWKKLPATKPEVKYANLAEAKEEGYQAPKPELPLDVLQHAIRFELEKKKVDGKPKVYRFTEDEYLKAYKVAVKNLEKDLLHYKKEEGAVEGPSSKSDEMVKVKLKESFKKIIRNILSENASKKKAFDLNGKPL